LGSNKAVIAARRMFEIDPFLRIEVLPGGLSTADVGDFLTGVDLLVEECDDIDLKFAVRAEARRRRIPVIMETSDRGTLDVERFDLAPERPLFHGLAPEPGNLRRLTTKEKVPLVLRIIETSHMSAELAASMVEIEQSVTTWPQLGSAAALGGGLSTDAARRVLLGSLQSSGRVRVDFGELVSDERLLLREAHPSAEESPLAEEARRLPPLPALERAATVAG